MKKYQSKVFLAFLIALVLGLSISSTYASEVTGTLSTEPEATDNTDSPSPSYSPQVNPNSANTLSGMVTGGIPVAEAESADTSTSGMENINTWIWITTVVASVVILSSLIYAFHRPSIDKEQN